MITEDQIIKWSGNKKAAFDVTKWFNEFADKYEVNTGQRVAAFMAQIIHESDYFKTTEEYASGKAYEGRTDLGNLVTGDGVRFKGRGRIMITGRKNYLSMSKIIFNDNRLIDNPEILEQQQYAMLSSFVFWDIKDLNKYSDLDIEQPITTNHHGIVKPFGFQTLIVNGGFNHFDRRVKIYNKICLDLKLSLYKLSA